MRSLRALLVCHVALLILLSACSDEKLEPYVHRLPEPHHRVPPAGAKLKLPDWRDFVIKDAKVSDHNETRHPPPTVESVREWLLSGKHVPHRIGMWLRRRKDAAEVLAAIRILLRDPEEETRVRAAMALVSMGPRAFPARGNLVRALRDPSGFVVDFSLRALAECGIPAESAFPTILTLLKSGERKVRYSAAALIGRMGPAGGFAVPELLAMLREDDTEMFNAAARSLAGIGSAAAPAVRMLANGLDREVRCVGSAAALGAVGPAAREALPRLRRLMRRGYGMVPVVAAWATWRISGDTSAALPCLVRALKRGGGSRTTLPVRIWLERRGERILIHLWGGATHFPELYEGQEPAGAAILALGLMGERAADAAPKLVGALSSYRSLRMHIVWALRRIGKGYGEHLVRHLVRTADSLHESELRLLRDAGRGWQKALVDELRVWPGTRGKTALRLLARVAGERAVLDELAYGEPISKLQIIAAWYEGRFPEPAFLHELRRRLTDPDVGVRRAAALALVPDRACLRVLRRMLSAEEPKDRSAAADALATYGPRAWSAVPELDAALSDPLDGVRWSAADALACIGPDARPALRSVWNLLSDPNPDVAKAAARALERIRATRRE